MTTVLQFALLGLGVGAIYALLGQGLVLIFRGSRVLNLAHGAFAMVGAFLFYELRTVKGLALAPSILVTVICVALLGVLVDQLVLRRLRKSSGLTQLMGTMAILLILQSIASLRYGSGTLLVDPIIEPHPTNVLGTTIGSDRLWLLAAAVGLTLVLAGLWRFTRMGWVMAAVSENRRSAAALGWSPERISAITWGLGAGLAGLAGLLIAPISELSVGLLTFAVIPALAAALIGGFRSFGLTLLGGLLLGVTESLISRYVNFTGAQSAAPLVIIAVVVLARGASLPQRGEFIGRLPRIGAGRIDPSRVLSGVAIAALAIGFGLSDPWLGAVSTWLAVATVLLSLVVMIGYAGQLSLAQFSLAGLGALIAARLVESAGWSFLPATVVGVLGTVLIGLIFALPALRTRGVNLAVITLALGVTAQELVFNNSTFTSSAAGTEVGSPSILGFNIDGIEHPSRYALLALAMFTLSAWSVANLRRGRSGRRLVAVRANERAAASMGIRVLEAKLYAFGLGGALAGLGGIMLAFRQTTIVYGSFNPISSLAAVADAVVGGIGFVAGPLVGGTLASGSIGQQVASDALPSAARYLPLVGGVLLLAQLIVAPDGLVHALGRALPRRRSRRAEPSLDIGPAVVERVAPAALEVSDLTVRYGGVTAVSDVSFGVRPGQVLGLIGPNGSGKTSIVDAVSGFARSTGSVRLDGSDISLWSAARRARHGVVRSFQGLELIEDLTVLENLLVAGDARDRAAFATDLVHPGGASLVPTAIAAVREFGLEAELGKRPSELSYGQRRLLAVARAVALAPSVLLLDEPVAGLDLEETREFAQLVAALAKQWGIAVLVIEHDIDFVMQICDEMLVLDQGKQIAFGTPSHVAASPAALEAYLGTEAEAEAAPR